jgi:hypothetical protein
MIISQCLLTSQPRMQFTSTSETSELGWATTKTDTAERSISIGTESLQVFLCTCLRIWEDYGKSSDILRPTHIYNCTQ